jgi:hypothetical protein
VNSLEARLGSKVTIGHVEIDFLHGVKLDDVMIYDNRGDTLLYAHAVKVDIRDINYTQQHVVINYLSLDGANIKLQRHKEDKRWAYLMLLDHLKSKNKDKKGGKDWYVKINNIKINDCIFQYQDMHSAPRPIEFDENHVYFSGLNGKISDLVADQDTITMMIDEFSGIEQTGFKVNNLKSRLKITPVAMDFSELQITTPYSYLEKQFIMHYDDYDDFDDFLAKVRLEGHIENSKVSFDDLQYFAAELRGMHQVLYISGDARGTVDNLKCRNMNVKFGSQSYFTGNASFKGLPDIYETYFDIATRDAYINKQDLEYLLDQKLPDNISELGNISTQLKSVGFLRDFVVQGDFNTRIGYVNTNINFKLPREKMESYSGTASFRNFDLGKITGNNMFEKINGTMTMKGTGLSPNTIKSNIDANLESLTWNGYAYHNIQAHGTIANKLFSGTAIVNDTNVHLNFNGTIDYSTAVYHFDFKADISNANLKLLHLDSSSSVLNANLNIEFTGNSLPNLQGGTNIPYISWKRNGRLYEFRKLNVSSITRGDRRMISATSDVLDATIDGNYDLNTIHLAIENELHGLYPDYFKYHENIADQDIVFDIHIKKPEEFINLLNPKLSLKPGKFNGYFNSRTHTWALNGDIAGIAYDNLTLDSITVKSERKEKEPYLVDLKTKSFASGENLFATSSKAGISFSENLINLTLSTYDTTSGNLVTTTDAFRFFPDSISLTVENGTAEFNNVAFSFTQKTPVFLNRHGAIFSDFKVVSGEQFMVFNGIITGSESDQLGFDVHHFQLHTLNSIFKNIGADLFGELNGNFSISNPYHNPYFATDSNGIRVKYFQVDKDTFGNLRINSSYKSELNIVNTSVRFTDGQLQNVWIDGKIYPNRENNYLDFDIRVNETPVSVLNFVFKGIASDLEGTIAGNARLTGSFSKPDITGKGFIKGGGFTVDYLKTHYRFENEIVVKNNAFEFNDAKMYDENNRTAIASGRISHNYYTDWRIDIRIKNFSEFKVLNTTLRDNNLFYGQGYATGNVSITGDLDHIKMVLNLKSNKNTVIYIPLTSPEYSSKSSYITFRDKTKKVKTNYTIDLSGIELEMNLDMTPDASIKMIFDSQLGDVIEGNGYGIINMKITPTGEFTMNGYYEIEEGKYVFTKYEVFNKPFLVKRGGRITWDGDPYQAKVNLEAVYSISQANASALLAGTTSGGSDITPTIPVDCILYLRGLLLKPDITFDLEVPKLQNFNNPQIENTVKTFISGWRQNPDEMNRQVFSLLFFKSFFPQNSSFDVATGVQGGINTTVGDLITSQLTNWLSQAFTNFNFGLTYNKYDPNRNAQWIFKLNKKFFNDRLVLEGNAVYEGGEQSNGVTGNLSAQVLLDKQGQVRFTVFSKRTNNSLTYNQNVFTNGVGFYLRKEFNTFRRKKNYDGVNFIPNGVD